MDYIINSMSLYGQGISLFFDLNTIGLLFLGALIGTVFGALPGLTSTMCLAICTPLTFGMTSEQAIIFLIVIYATAVFGGSISAVLLNIPGTPGSIATTFDGYTMAQNGEAGRSLGLVCVSSSLGGLVGMIFLIFFAPMVARVALKFNSVEYMLLAVLGLSLIAYISGKSILKGFIAATIGLLMATVGMDPIQGYARFTMNNLNLVGGVGLIPVLIGFFGITEILLQLEGNLLHDKKNQKIKGILQCFSDVKKNWKTFLRSSLLGTFIGSVPGAGGSIACIASYALEKQSSKEPEKLGKGAPSGVIASEAANNSTVGGALIPMLTLGIPGDPMTAVLIGALLFHGLVPGPLLFIQHPYFISAIFLTLTFSAILIFAIGIIGLKPLSKFLQIPYTILLPLILVLCIIGSFAIEQNMFDVNVALACGICGYIFNKIKIPAAPIVLGMILGPLLEENLRRTLMVSKGQWPSLTSTTSIILMLLIAAVLLLPIFQKYYKKSPKLA